MHLFEFCSVDVMTIYHASDIVMEYFIEEVVWQLFFVPSEHLIVRKSCFGRPQVTSDLFLDWCVMIMILKKKKDSEYIVLITVIFL